MFINTEFYSTFWWLQKRKIDNFNLVIWLVTSPKKWWLEWTASLTIILYLKIIAISHHHKKQIAAMPTYPLNRPNGKLDMKAVTTSFLVLSVYSLVVIPLLVLILKGFYGLKKYSVLFLRLLWYSSSWMDVFIYLWRNKQQLKFFEGTSG